jgi:hypothetical protein
VILVDILVAVGIACFAISLVMALLGDRDGEP